MVEGKGRKGIYARLMLRAAGLERLVVTKAQGWRLA